MMRAHVEANVLTEKLTEAEKREMVKSMLTGTNRNTREAAFRKELHNFLKQRLGKLPNEMTTEDALIYLEAKNRGIWKKKAQPRHQLTLLHRIQRMGHQYPRINNHILDSIAMKLRRMAAIQNVRQAPPISVMHLRKAYDSATPVMQKTLGLAWKTVSRIGDVQTLSDTNFKTEIQGRQPITFSYKTKTSKTRPFYIALYPSIKLQTKRETHLRDLLHQQQQHWATTNQVTKFLRQLFPQCKYSAHSIKRGALQHIVEQSDPKQDPNLVTTLPLILKHRTPNTIPDNSVRYANNQTRHRLWMTTGASIVLDRLCL